MAIQKFDDEFAFLSNFYPSPIIVKGKEYPTVEHLFQAFKTTDPREREQVRLQTTPGKAKQMGRKVTLRKNWFKIRKSVMSWCIKLKFQNPELQQKLLNTGNQKLIEGNYWHDNFWGVCSCNKCGKRGKNMLGRILMQERENLQQKQIHSS